jgi:phthiocerol/phenolphthiocerol synthesis type-I polyketide synthase E
MESYHEEGPREGLEEGIAEVWREAFKIERIGRNDNFFELGGTSVLGLDVVERLEARLAIRVPILVLFQYPTIREMAEIITAAGES